MKKLCFIVTAVVFTLNSGIALAGPWEDIIAELPSGTFDLDSCYYDDYGVEHYLDIYISNDTILDGEHGAWCLDVYQDIECDDYGAIVGDLLIPGTNPTYDMLNWILNHYDQYVGQLSDDGVTPYVIGDVQAAIWLATTGMPAYQRPDPDPAPPAQDLNPWSKWAWGLHTWGDWTDHTGGIIHPGGPITNAQAEDYDKTEYDADVARAMEIYDDAYDYGPGYIPNCDDEVLGLIILPFVDQAVIGVQPLLITVPAPCVAGCTPGFWKNNWDKKDGNAWNNYDGDDDFNVVFGVTIEIFTGGNPKKDSSYNDDPTLFEALGANGGGINALARHATAALLNMSSPCAGQYYPYESIAALKADVAAAVAAGEGAIQDLHVKLASYNELGCPINQKGECMD